MNFSQKTRHFFVILLFRLLTLLPLKVLFLISEAVTVLVYHVIGYRRNVVFTNLNKAFPDKNSAEIKRIARKYYRHMSVMMVENIYLRFISRKDFSRRIILENREVLEDLYQKNKNIIGMTGHFGNWEYFAGLSLQIQFTVAAVYKQLSDPVFDKIYNDIRSRHGVRTIEMKETLRKVIEFGKESNPLFLLMIADQAPNDSNHWITFLNQDTNVFLGSEKLARKFDMPVVYIEVLRHKKGTYRMIPTLITENPKDTKPFEITERYFQLLEASIKRSPRYWLWSHKRWKHTRTAE